MIERAVFRRWDKGDPPLPEPLDAPSQLVMLALLSLADPDGVIPDDRHPSLAELARMVQFGRSTVARALNRLEAAGWVVRSRPEVARAISDHETTRYTLHRPAVSSTAVADASPVEPCPETGLGVVPERDGSLSEARPAAGGDLSPSGTPASPAAGHFLLPDRVDPSTNQSSSASAALPADDRAAILGADVPSPRSRRTRQATPARDNGAVRRCMDLVDFYEGLPRLRPMAPKVRGQLYAVIDEAIDTGCTDDEIRKALQTLHGRRNVGPGVLASILEDMSKAGTVIPFARPGSLGARIAETDRITAEYEASLAGRGGASLYRDGMTIDGETA